MRHHRNSSTQLVEYEDVIIQPLTHVKYASRSLKRGEQYIPPPETVDPRGLDRAELDTILDESNHSMIRTLAARVNLGRIYGNAVCTAAGIGLDEPADSLDDEQRQALSDAMTGLLEELSEGE